MIDQSTFHAFAFYISRITARLIRGEFGLVIFMNLRTTVSLQHKQRSCWIVKYVSIASLNQSYASLLILLLIYIHFLHASVLIYLYMFVDTFLMNYFIHFRCIIYSDIYCVHLFIFNKFYINLCIFIIPFFLVNLFYMHVFIYSLVIPPPLNLWISFGELLTLLCTSLIY